MALLSTMCICLWCATFAFVQNIRRFDLDVYVEYIGRDLTYRILRCKLFVACESNFTQEVNPIVLNVESLYEFIIGKCHDVKAFDRFWILLGNFFFLFKKKKWVTTATTTRVFMCCLTSDHVFFFLRILYFHSIFSISYDYNVLPPTTFCPNHLLFVSFCSIVSFVKIIAFEMNIINIYTRYIPCCCCFGFSVVPLFHLRCASTIY